MSTIRPPLAGQGMERLLARMRLLEVDHAPDGWPAVQMRDISALLVEIERRCGIGGELIATRRERDAERAENHVLRRVLKAAVELTCAPGWEACTPTAAALELTLREAGFIAPAGPLPQPRAPAR